MKIIIAGSRSIGIEFYEELCDAIRTSKFNITQIVSGRARGVDTLGEIYGERHNIPVILMPADWNKYGKAAGYIRNAEMANIADAAIVLWDGVSRGSLNMVENMNKLNKPVFLRKVKLHDNT